MMKNGNFFKTTVEITFNGKKVRVSKDVAAAIAKAERGVKPAPKK